MRDYGKVYSIFWHDQDMRSLSEDGRVMALYLMTCPHGNMLGCFRLTDAYAADDLQWSIERVSNGFAELFQARFMYRCERTLWVFIRKYLDWNKFENPNVGKAAEKLFESMRGADLVKSLLCGALREFGNFFPPAVLDEFEANSEPFDNPFELSSNTRALTIAITVATAVTKPEPKPNTLVEQKPLDDVETIFAYWQKMMKSPSSKLDDKRRAVITKAMKRYSPADICKAIRGCSKTPHNMGQNKQKTKYNAIGLILRDADHIDRFILADAGQARAAEESVDDINARVMNELLGTPPDDGMTLEAEGA